MKAKQSKPRRKLSFAVDREEIEINSDWVNAVMGPASQPREGLFFVPDANNATGANKTSDAEIATGETLATPSAQHAPEIKSATVEYNAPAEQKTPGADISPVAEHLEDPPAATVSSAVQEVVIRGAEQSATVADLATVAQTPTRKPRPRAIRRVTDGLTTGQYAVYSLMFEHGNPEHGAGHRLFRGGYADLRALTGLSKRGIQNVVSELQEKGVISRHQMPGHHRTETSIYRVPAPEDVVQTWLAQGLRFAFGKSKILSNTATVA